MKKFIFILLITINCSTATYKQEVDYTPSMEIGCAQYEGTVWEKCMSKLLRNKQSIYSMPPVTIDTKEKYRVSEREVMVKQKTCFGENVFCYYHYDKRYDPTFLYIVQNHPITRILIFAAGLLVGTHV